MGAHLLQARQKLLGLWRRLMLAVDGSDYSKKTPRQFQERGQVSVNAHPLRQEGCLGLEDLQEAGVRQGAAGR